ncbi:MAG TPA: ATP-binding protein [Gaiellaceae bacterium]|nr:ATP-binding protein [Gaiellaceae bacterium]
MAGPTFPASTGEVTAEAERVVAWLRIPAIALLALSQGLEHPHPHETGFLITLAAFSAWSAGLLAWVHLRPAGARLALAATAVDIVAISVLAVLSGGAFSHARLAFFLVPVAVAFRFRPAITAAATVVTTAAYVIQAVAHPAVGEPQAARFIVTQAGFLAWVGLACVLLSMLLARQTELVSRLAETRSRLVSDALSAEQRERKALAEALHDHAIQNLLSARHEVEEVGETLSHPGLDRVDAALTETVGQLRDAVFELHPYVLEEAGLEAALRSVAQQAATRAGFELQLDLRYGRAHPQDQLVFSAARELLSNVVRHADAGHVAVRLAERDDAVELVVQDDGRGFPPEHLARRLADGHVGLASQRVRIEAAGGTMNVVSAPEQGTRVRVRVPDDSSGRSPGPAS